jgi:hypothetical protein
MGGVMSPLPMAPHPQYAHQYHQEMVMEEDYDLARRRR